MVSILIPVYNFDPGQLLQDLSAQLTESGREGEIIVGNDCSDASYKPVFDRVSRIPGVRVYNSDKNLGRSLMRNTLSEMARFPYLLFIDGDASSDKGDYLENYLSVADERTVICGGTAYHVEKPDDNTMLLRWRYGIKREARPAQHRSRNPYNSFSSFNFFIPAGIFKSIMFNTAIRGYGHEDTLFGIELERGKINLKHIDNPLIHTGLDSSGIFLGKTREGLENLLGLYHTYEDPEILEKRIRVLHRYLDLRRAGMGFLISWFCHAFSGSVKKNLTGASPSIFLFDLYKLCLLNEIKA